ncbi:unnamed protein product [Brassicogethes aeneus]|uniref:Uncharacterized protein n=1 Tax=Brassicogethes aeneus TaxID=1431903 RepID=A0A9P0B550_BRAAE|nr:unnamed protein product [Brassicogethes aeneus]
MVRPIITYAALIWWHATKTRTVKQILSRITGSMTTTPTAAMENILGLPPLHIQIKAEALAGAKRLISNKAEVISNIRHNAIFEELQNTGSPAIRTDKAKVKHFNKAFISKRIKAEEINNQIAQLRQEENLIWYVKHKRSKTCVSAGIKEVSQQGS